MTIKEYNDYEAKRQAIISHNRSCRMSGHLDRIKEVPPKIERPLRPQLYDVNGDYVGTYPYETTEAEACEHAKEHGEKGPFTVKWVW